MHDHEPHGHSHHHGSELSPIEARVRALESILVEKGYVDPAALDAIVDTYETRIGPHHMVVCTLCSCYPWPVLGLPPVWYKSAPYRSRVVLDPRGVLAEFGVTLPAETAIRVWDSTAEVRYLVVPQRPPGTEGLSEAQLAELVTRDSMIGTGLPRAPGRDGS